MRRLIAPTAAVVLSASPAVAASGPFFSLANTDFVVLIAFIIFIAVLTALKVPSKIGGMLDQRAEGIKSELDEARALREEAQTLLASFERKQTEAQSQVDRIVATAREEASRAAEDAKKELARSIERRIAGAEDQIASAEAGAIKEVRDRAIQVAVAAAREVLAKQMTKAEGAKLIDDAISQVDTKLH